jgi:DNA adenine methylase
VTVALRPPFPYYGGKTGIASTIAGLLPVHDHYVEPYAGSCAVLLAKPRSKMETVNDLDQALVTFWRVLRDRKTELVEACTLTPHSRAEYLACRRDDVPDSDLEVARRVWVVLTQGRGGTLRESKTGWRHFTDPGGSSVSMADNLDGYVDRMQAVASRLHNVSLECMPALDLIAKYGAHADVLLYVDPPYLGSVRGWGNNYRHEMKTEAEHRELADALHACAAAVVLSGYPSNLYDRELYAGWDRHTITTSTGNANPSTRVRVEVLWSNRPLGVQRSLFDDRDAAA